MKKYYITTAIDYVNAAPHLGHAYEKIASDVLARWHRLQGDQVWFLTGTDEHGSKIEKTAHAKGIEPQAYTDQVAECFKTTWQDLNISYNRFVRTTEDAHKTLVTFLWNQLVAKGFLYKDSYIGLYCSGCENFVTPRDLTDVGECPNHLTKPDPVEEENWFFKMSHPIPESHPQFQELFKPNVEENTLKDGIRRYILKHQGHFIQPEFRTQEVLKMLDGIEDFSVSRSKKAVTWGIPVPNDDTQVIYVWIDALSNYLTGCGEKLGYLETLLDSNVINPYWPADVHMIGKDILKFHAIYWPALLIAADIPLPKTIYAHGFITFNDSKISKSTGNIVSPQSLVDRFHLPNTDPIRYYLMTCTTFGQDGNFTEEDFKTKVNADLANNLGNLLNRSLNMTQKYFDGKVPQGVLPDPVKVQQAKTLADIESYYERYQFHRAAELALEMADWANKEINEQEPWTLFKEGKIEELAQLMYTVLETLRRTALVLFPIIPVLSQDIWEQLGCTGRIDDKDFFIGDFVNKPLSPGQETKLKGPLLLRLDSEIVGAGKKK